jgi:hypothetical protein
MTRRELIAGLLATATVGDGVHAQVLPGAPTAVQEWYDRTMRWIQLILVESDPPEMDTDWWLDLFRRTHTDGICLSAGGICSFYPTRIPFHHRSTFMKEGDDPFGRMAEGCRKLDMTIVARTDSHSCLADAAAGHPEWLNIDENGEQRRHPSMPETRFITCALGPYNFEFMTQVHREILTKYGVDGLFCNRWQDWPRGMCYCDSCQRLFRAASGKDLPRTTDPQDPLAIRYKEWSQARLTELWHLWEGECQTINPKFRYFTNIGLDIERLAELAPTALVEQQSRGSRQPWAFGAAAKERRAFFDKKPLIGLGGVTSGARQSVTTEAEIRIWMLDAIANGLRPWILKTSAVVPDKRWVPAMEKVYNWHWRNEKYMRNEENLARVAVVFAGPPSKPTEGAAGGNAASGMYQALVERRIPFEMLNGSKLADASRLDRFKLLILPNVTELSDAQCEHLRRFVNRGGSLLATFQTSLYDGSVQRGNFGLADLFGVAFAGQVESGGDNSYMRVQVETGGHPILRGLEGAGQILNTSRHVSVRAIASFSSPPLTRIPSFPTLPMEDIWPRTAKTEIPEVYLREVSPRSRIVYFPGDIDATFANGMEPDHALLLGNAVNWAMNEAQPVTVSGSGILDVTCWCQAASMTVHMVNMTNPFMLRSAYREAIPIGPQSVRIRVPEGKTARAVRLLVSGQTPQHAQSDRSLTLTVPSIADHEVVAIDL